MMTPLPPDERGPRGRAAQGNRRHFHDMPWMMPSGLQWRHLLGRIWQVGQCFPPPSVLVNAGVGCFFENWC